MSYQVRFTVHTKIDSDNLYSKLSGLDSSQLPVCCIETKKADSSQEEDAMDRFDNKEIMDTLILNEEFSTILNNTFPATLKGLPVIPYTKDCRANLCNLDDYRIHKLSTSIEVCQPITEESLILSESGTSDGSATEEGSNAIIFPPVYQKAVYPLFYKELMCSDKEHGEVTAHFIKEEWLTNELIEELMNFTPAVYESSGDMNKSATDHQAWFSRCCKHVFYKGRPFANYRQLDQYASLFMEAWKAVKHRD